jgi:predicted AAA+ superfamily ATPase
LTHIIENIIYNELIVRRASVDIGIVYSNDKDEKGKQKRTAREIDFVVSKGGKKVYIQSAYAMENPKKINTEMRPLSLTGDSFPKIVVRHDVRKRWYDDNGVLNIGIIDFLLDESLF